MITRRHLFRSIGGLSALGVSTAAYGVGVEPSAASRHPLSPHPAAMAGGFPAEDRHDRRHPCLRSLDVAGADRGASSIAPMRSTPISSCCSATMSPVFTRSRASFRRANGPRCWPGLKAPLGVHAVMGNHDYWVDRTVQRQGTGRRSRIARWRRPASPSTRTTSCGSPRTAAPSGSRASAISSPICPARRYRRVRASAPTISRRRWRRSPTMRRSSCSRTSPISRRACPRASRCSCPAIPMAARSACSAGRRRFRRSTACGSPMVTSG